MGKGITLVSVIAGCVLATWAVSSFVGDEEPGILNPKQATEPPSDVAAGERSTLVAATEDSARERIEASPKPESAIRLASDRSRPDPLALVGVPDAFKKDLELFATLARHDGVKIPLDLKLPMVMWADLSKRMRAFDEELQKIEKVRVPIVEKIAESKRRRGDCTNHKRPPANASKSEKAKYRKAMRNARKQTEPDQTIVRGGSGDEMWFVRVSASDDVRLAAIYDRIHDGRRLAIGGLLMTVEPFLQSQKKK